MPNRILKESICSSDSINNLSSFEETFFYRLIVNCDDYGRFDARPAILKARLFPLKDRISLKDIESALVRLADVGCVRLYRVDSKPYLYLPTWEVHQNVRAKKSKYPEPDENSEKQYKANESHDNTSENICTQMKSNESKCSRNPNPNPNTNTESESYSGNARLDAALEDYKAFRKQIKKPMTDRAVQLAVKKLIQLAGDDVDEKIAIIEQSIMNGWQGLFPLKDQQKGENHGSAKHGIGADENDIVSQLQRLGAGDDFEGF